MKNQLEIRISATYKGMTIWIDPDGRASFQQAHCELDRLEARYKMMLIEEKEREIKSLKEDAI